MTDEVVSDEAHQEVNVAMETTSATAQCRLLCSIHNIPIEDHAAAEQWISTVLESEFHVDHCQRIEGEHIMFYTVFRKNVVHLIFFIISAKSRSIVEISSLTDSQGNALCN